HSAAPSADRAQRRQGLRRRRHDRDAIRPALRSQRQSRPDRARPPDDRAGDAQFYHRLYEEGGEVIFIPRAGLRRRTPSPQRGGGWGEGGRKIQKRTQPSEAPQPILLPHSASKTRVNALMGEKGRSFAARTNVSQPRK